MLLGQEHFDFLKIQCHEIVRMGLGNSRIPSYSLQDHCWTRGIINLDYYLINILFNVTIVIYYPMDTCFLENLTDDTIA